MAHFTSTHGLGLLGIALLLAGCSATPSKDGDAGAHPEADVTPESAATTDVLAPEASSDDSTIEASVDPDAPSIDAVTDHLAPPPDGDDWDAGVCAPEPTPRCGQVRHIASLAELTAVGVGLSWQTVNYESPGVLTISEDLVADVDLTLDGSTFLGPTLCETFDAGCGGDGSTFPDPTSCRSGDPGDAGDLRCTMPYYRAGLFPRTYDVHVAGLTCLAPQSTFPWGCEGMAIAQGTTFRIRKVVQFGALGYRVFVEFDRGCSTACGVDETRCEANQTCLRRGYDICRWCDGTDKQICACRNRCGSAMRDGVQCGYAESDDIELQGACRGGRCCVNFEPSICTDH